MNKNIEVPIVVQPVRSAADIQADRLATINANTGSDLKPGAVSTAKVHDVVDKTPAPVNVTKGGLNPSW